MRIQTIKRRVRLVPFSAKELDLLYIMMYGIEDKSTEIGKKNNDLWTRALAFIFARFTIFDI